MNLETSVKLSHDADNSLDDSFECIRMYSDSRGCDVIFYGKSIAYDERWDSTAYLTKGRRIAVTNQYNMALEVFDSFEDFAAGFAGRPQLVSDVTAALAEFPTTPLDV